MCENADGKLYRRIAALCTIRKLQAKLQIAAKACREEGAAYDLRHDTMFDQLSRREFDRWFEFLLEERLWTLLTLLVQSSPDEAWLSIVHKKHDEWRKLLHTPVHITAWNHVQMLQGALEAAHAL